MTRVFISFREGDSGPAMRVADQIHAASKDFRAFAYTDAMPAGVRWADHIGEEIARADIFVIVVGKAWLDRRAELFDSNDVVRKEIELALQRDGLPILSLTVDKAEVPTRHDLPPELAPLLDWQVTDLPPAYFREAVRDKVLPVLTAETRAAEKISRKRPAAPSQGSTSTPPKKRRKIIRLLALGVAIFLGLALLIPDRESDYERRGREISEISRAAPQTAPDLGPVIAEVDVFELADGRNARATGIAYAGGGTALWIGLDWSQLTERDDGSYDVRSAAELLRLDPATARETGRIALDQRTPLKLDTASEGAILAILGHSTKPALLRDDTIVALGDGIDAQFLNGDLSDDGRRLVTYDSENVRVWDVASSAEIRVLPAEKWGGNSCDAVAVSPRSDIIATTAESVVRQWGPDGTVLRTIDAHWGECPIEIAFSPDGKVLFWLDGEILDFFDVGSGERLRRLYVGGESDMRAAFLPDGTRVATMTRQSEGAHTLRIWNWRDGIVLGQHRSGNRYRISVSPDGKFIATTGEDPALEIIALPN